MITFIYWLIYSENNSIIIIIIIIVIITLKCIGFQESGVAFYCFINAFFDVLYIIRNKYRNIVFFIVVL